MFAVCTDCKVELLFGNIWEGKHIPVTWGALLLKYPELFSLQSENTRAYKIIKSDYVTLLPTILWLKESPP